MSNLKITIEYSGKGHRVLLNQTILLGDRMETKFDCDSHFISRSIRIHTYVKIKRQTKNRIFKILFSNDPSLVSEGSTLPRDKNKEALP